MKKNNKEMHIVKQNWVWQTFIFIVLMIMLLAFYKVVDEALEKKAIIGQQAVYEFDLLSEIKYDNLNEREFILSGKLVKPNTKLCAIYLLLKNARTNEEEVFEISSIEEKESNNAIYQKTNSTEYSFRLMLDKAEIDKKECFEVLLGIVYSTENMRYTKKTSLQKYLYDGQMFDYNVFDFKAPIIEDKMINNVITEGTLCAYSPQEELWIYRKGSQLYWIIKEGYSINSDCNIKIPVHYFAFSREDLPASRQQSAFDNKDFLFENREYESDELTGYRVAVMNIPTEYKTTHVRTGVYDDINKKWVCEVNFQMYEFEE